TEPFPGIGFQTTNEQCSPDDLPCREVKQSNPISAQYRANCAKHKRSFQGMFRPINFGERKRPRVQWSAPSLTTSLFHVLPDPSVRLRIESWLHSAKPSPRAAS